MEAKETEKLNDTIENCLLMITQKRPNNPVRFMIEKLYNQMNPQFRLENARDIKDYLKESEGTNSEFNVKVRST